MIENNHNNNTKRIAKNSLLLYFRMFISMCVGLYTSRVVLSSLGISDYGIYNVIGGVVTMFSFLTGSLASAISRYLTYSLGKEEMNRLKILFSTSFYTQVALAIIVAIMIEIVGVWFLENKLNIPDGRIEAALWAMQCSIVIFIINMVCVPYNASIIAHEKMTAFAYISIVDVLLKLIVAYALLLSDYDKLKLFSLLLTAVSIINLLSYYIYCRNNFRECKLDLNFDRTIFKDMSGFTGWSLLGNGCALLNTQGVNICTNMFFGVAINAARGIADQVNAFVVNFINNFTTAINPQITKSYATGDYNYLFQLICKGSKISFFLFLLFTIPLVLEADEVLALWLGHYPSKAPIFVRLVLISQMIDFLGNTTARSVWATGKVKKYYLLTSSISFLVLPISYMLFQIGMPPESSYVVFIIIYILLIPIRLYVLHGLIPSFSPKMFFSKVIYPSTIVTISSLIIPCLFYYFYVDDVEKPYIVIIVSLISVLLSSFFLGLSNNEKKYIKDCICIVIGRLKRCSKTVS